MRRGTWLALVAVVLLIGAGLGLAWWVPLPERVAMPGSTVLRWRDGEVAHVVLAPDERWRVPVGLDEVDPLYVEALLRFEDRRFWYHPGVDPLAIGRALIGNLAAGRVVSGASTLTMQVVRMAEPRPRTLRSKVLEAARAVQLELRMSKAEILATYLSLLPFGGNLEGIEAASQAFFGHSARHLSPAEIATLLAIPQRPSLRAPGRAAERALREARDTIGARLLAEGLLEPRLGGGQGGTVTAEQALARILETPVPSVAAPLPRQLPHVWTWMQRRGTVASAIRLAPGDHMTTLLDAGVQRLVERQAGAVADGLRARGIDDLSVVVVETANAEVRALLGGVDFAANRLGAQVPSFAVPRSPGSTLKPLLYARALDRGLLLPGTLLPDVPVRYGGYAPANYDGRHEGMVPAEEALSRSLNLPFVQLLQQVGIEPFLGDLRSMGARSLRSQPGQYGLSAIVGGVELSPLEVAAFYTTLAAGGVVRPLRLFEAEPVEEGRRAFGPGAVWLTGRALARRDRPDFPARHLLVAAPRFIRWKTGTSFGNRDAWAVGYGDRYTVVVWMGNLDQRPSAALVGAEVAAPLLFDLFDALGDGPLNDPGAPSQAPEDLGPVEVCPLSGRRPGPACPVRGRALGIVERVPALACELHQRVEVDLDSGLRVGPGCRAGRRTREEVRVAWPEEVQAWLRDRYQAEPRVPPWHPDCAPPDSGRPPRLVQPAEGQAIILIPGLDAERQQVALRALSTAGPLSWFVGGRLLQTVEADETVWWTPREGEWEILVMDAAGQSTRRVVRVLGGAAVGLGSAPR